MISCSSFYNLLKENQVEFFAGVPDSLLKDICAYITNAAPSKNHVITPNEGSAIALGAGFHLATGQIPLIYMQNSGIGNALNPLTSLADQEVYSIPMVLMIGWRGKPGIKDEPQHIKQGRISTDLLDCLEIPYQVLPKDWGLAKHTVEKLIRYGRETSQPVAILVENDTFELCKLEKNFLPIESEIKREEALKILVESLPQDAKVISTTGKTSRELYEIRESLGHLHGNDFLVVGSMGHASILAQGIAVHSPDCKVYCFDGDGAALMHMGSIPLIGSLKLGSFRHILFNNAAHESVGGQPTVGNQIDFVKIALGSGYASAISVHTMNGLKEVLPQFIAKNGPSLLEIKIKIGSRGDLGRPKETPIECKKNFMNGLQSKWPLNLPSVVNG